MSFYKLVRKTETEEKNTHLLFIIYIDAWKRQLREQYTNDKMFRLTIQRNENSSNNVKSLDMHETGNN